MKQVTLLLHQLLLAGVTLQQGLSFIHRHSLRHYIAPSASSLRQTRQRFGGWLSRDPILVHDNRVDNVSYPKRRLSSSLYSSSEKSNEYLVKARISLAAAKKETRKSYLEQDRQRNLRIKKLLHSSTNNDLDRSDGTQNRFKIPQLFAVRVIVDKDLRQKLKKGRVFIEYNTDGCTTYKGLKLELHSFFRSLLKSSYLLSAGLPVVQPDGSILSPIHEYNITDSSFARFWDIQSDEDVVMSFEKADAFFKLHNDGLCEDAQNRMKRASILLHIRKDPDYKDLPEPKYLENMADPKDSKEFTMISFYSFPHEGVKDPEVFRLFLRKMWRPFAALGRVYIASEGINAQMAIPSNVLSNFIQCCMEIAELGENMENGINVDPVPLSIEDFAVAGGMDGKPEPPFKNLYIRVRHQVVADGLDKPLNWQSAGYDMPPMEWHRILRDRRLAKLAGNSGRDDDRQRDDHPLILDCRNKYETSVGRFEGAEPLNTENFRDTWDVLKEKLKDSPKDKPIMTYCTGGIRCVKVGAYLQQELGFTNVSRLAGGIIAYDRTLNEVKPEQEPMFKGTNYVFDGRVGRKITDEKLAECETCGVKTNLVTNCMNDSCHKRMAQCESCRIKFLGTCSDTCRTIVVKGRMAPLKKFSKEAVADGLDPVSNEVFNSVDEYSLGYSTFPPPIMKEIELNTAKYLPTGIHMLSNTAQGRLLSSLTSMSREGRVLEIGTFTGYTTACFLEGAANVVDVLDDRVKVGSRESGAYVLSLERDKKAYTIATSHIDIMSKFGNEKDGAKAASRLRNCESLLDTISDSDSPSTFSYKNAGCELIHCSDALAIIEAMSNGTEFTTLRPFDIVFIDADKTRFLDYIEACLSSNKVLKKGGYMIVDNVLWKGMVLDSQRNNDNSNVQAEGDYKEIKKSRRAKKLANIIHNFNSAIIQDERAEVLMLPIRDGLSLIRKK